MKDRHLTLNEVATSLNVRLSRREEQLRPIHASASMTAPDGRIFRCHIYTSPPTRAVLRYPLESESLR